MAWVDVSTGRFYAATFAPEQLADQLARIEPAEVLVSDEQAPLLSGLAGEIADHAAAGVDVWAQQQRIEALAKHFGTHASRASALIPNATSNDVPALRAAGAILELSGGNAKGVARAHRSTSALFVGDAAGDRPGHAPQPGACRQRSATAGGMVRSSARSTAR